MEKIDLETLKTLVPRSVYSNINQNIVDTINNVSTDIDYAREYRRNIITFIQVLKEGKYSFEEYINAVKYCTYKILGDKNIEAYSKAFPDRYQEMIKKGLNREDIHSRVGSYNKGKLVCSIMEKMIIPVEILYRDFFDDAAVKLHELMYTARSEMVQYQSAKSIIENFKPTKEKIEIDMTIKESEDVSKKYDQALEFAAKKMQQMISKGMNVKDVTNIKLTKKEELEEPIDVEHE